MAIARNVEVSAGAGSFSGSEGSVVRSTAARSLVIAMLCALGFAILAEAYFVTNAGDGYPDRVVDWTR